MGQCISGLFRKTDSSNVDELTAPLLPRKPTRKQPAWGARRNCLELAAASPAHAVPVQRPEQHPPPQPAASQALTATAQPAGQPTAHALPDPLRQPALQEAAVNAEHLNRLESQILSLQAQLRQAETAAEAAYNAGMEQGRQQARKEAEDARRAQERDALQYEISCAETLTSKANADRLRLRRLPLLSAADIFNEFRAKRKQQAANTAAQGSVGTLQELGESAGPPPLVFKQVKVAADPCARAFRWPRELQFIDDVIVVKRKSNGCIHDLTNGRDVSGC